MFSRAISILLWSSLLLPGTRTFGNTASSLTAYFKGDALQEAVLRLTPDREDAVRRLNRTLDATCRFVRLEIVARQADGALVSVTSYSSEELRPNSPAPLEHPFFIYGLPEKHAVGTRWEGRVYPAGQFKYKGADSSDQTVNALAVSKEWAIRAMESGTAAAADGQPDAAREAGR